MAGGWGPQSFAPGRLRQEAARDLAAWHFGRCAHCSPRLSLRGALMPTETSRRERGHGEGPGEGPWGLVSVWAELRELWCPPGPGCPEIVCSAAVAISLGITGPPVSSGQAIKRHVGTRFLLSSPLPWALPWASRLLPTPWGRPARLEEPSALKPGSVAIRGGSQAEGRSLSPSAPSPQSPVIGLADLRGWLWQARKGSKGGRPPGL